MTQRPTGPTRALRVFRHPGTTRLGLPTHTGGCCSSLPPCHPSASLPRCVLDGLLGPPKVGEKGQGYACPKTTIFLEAMCCRSINNPHQDAGGDKSLLPGPAWQRRKAKAGAKPEPCGFGWARLPESTPPAASQAGPQRFVRPVGSRERERERKRDKERKKKHR